MAFNSTTPTFTLHNQFTWSVENPQRCPEYNPEPLNGLSGGRTQIVVYLKLSRGFICTELIANHVIITNRLCNVKVYT
jgi:hypothetical protein